MINIIILVGSTIAPGFLFDTCGRVPQSIITAPSGGRVTGGVDSAHYFRFVDDCDVVHVR